MSFKYINPGYAELLSMSGGTTVTGEQYSKTGVSFWQPEEYKGLSLSEAPNEFYARLDMYLKNPMNASDSYLEIGIGFGNRVCMYPHRGQWDIEGVNDGSTVFDTYKTAEFVRPDAINSLWFHIKQGRNNDGIFHVIVNERELYNKRNRNIWYANDNHSKVIAVRSKNDGILISNLIISDEEISPREQVIMLPVQATQTDMTDCGDGSYEATAANQEILQTVNVAALSAQYGADSRVTGISLLGNPAYRTAEGLCALTAIERSGGTVTEYGRHVVEQNPASIIMDGRAASMTIAELTGRQFGWRAGT